MHLFAESCSRYFICFSHRTFEILETETMSCEKPESVPCAGLVRFVPPCDHQIISPREHLGMMLEEKALRRGDFTLASGKKSTYYLDCKEVTLDPLGAHLIGAEIVRGLMLRPTLVPDAVGGLAIGADPITTAVVMSSYCVYKHVPWLEGVPRPITGFMVRKEIKDHGVQNYIAGPLKPGMTTVIVEDVCTTGGSALKAVERVEEFGCKVNCVFGIVDRLEGAAKTLQDAGHILLSLFTIRDFGIEPPTE